MSVLFSGGLMLYSPGAAGKELINEISFSHIRYLYIIILAAAILSGRRNLIEYYSDTLPLSINKR